MDYEKKKITTINIDLDESEMVEKILNALDINYNMESAGVFNITISEEQV